MQVHELLKAIVGLYPSFSAQWESTDNLSRNGDDFTPHGLCSEFSSFFQSQALPLSEFAARALYQRIEQIIAADQRKTDPVANALCTCFLENIAHTAAGEASIPFMGKESRAFFRHWHAGNRSGA